MFAYTRSNDKSFGLVFAVLFCVFGSYLLWIDFKIAAIIILSFAILFVALAYIAPQLLAPLNRRWSKLGALLGKIVSPIVLGVIFFVLITPISIIMRLFGRDELKMKKRSLDSYWVDRSPPGPSSDSFKNQY